ncbi:MAG: hypothetical protein QTN59_13405 [Candidatus Electrothrix communis]|nr:MAG: hypothetical protein QTN59_13405 [Candidatus Electrothrix communis]
MKNTKGLDEYNRGIPVSLGMTSDSEKRRIYSPPRVLSAELLEAAAATCDGTGGYGKTAPSPCSLSTLGS